MFFSCGFRENILFSFGAQYFLFVHNVLEQGFKIWVSMPVFSQCRYFKGHYSDTLLCHLPISLFIRLSLCLSDCHKICPDCFSKATGAISSKLYSNDK